MSTLTPEQLTNAPRTLSDSMTFKTGTLVVNGAQRSELQEPTTRSIDASDNFGNETALRAYPATVEMDVEDARYRANKQHENASRAAMHRLEAKTTREIAETKPKGFGRRFDLQSAESSEKFAQMYAEKQEEDDRHAIEELRLKKEEEHLKTPIGQLEKALEDYEPALEALAHVLKGPIMRRDWDAVIGDDVSGRFPTLFLARIMRRYAATTHTQAPNIMFAAPDRDMTLEQERKMKEHFARAKGRLGKNVLLVTEYIAWGEHLASLKGALPSDVHVDIAIGAINPDLDDEKKRTTLRSFGDSQVYFTGIEAFPSLTFSSAARAATGRDKDPNIPTSFRRENTDPALIRRALELVNQKADEVYEKEFKGAT